MDLLDKAMDVLDRGMFQLDNAMFQLGGSMGPGRLAGYGCGLAGWERWAAVSNFLDAQEWKQIMK